MANTGQAKLNIEIGYTVNRQGLDQIVSDLRKVQTQASEASLGDGLTKDLRQASDAAKQLEQILNESWNPKMDQLDLSKLNEGIKSTFGSVTQLRQSLEQSGEVGAAAYQKVASSVLNTNLNLKQSHKLLDQMAETMGNTIKWGIASSIMNRMSGTIQEAIGFTKSLDRSLNDIRIVTGKSAEEMDKFAVSANQAAKELAKGTTDYTEASLIFYQQGLNDDEVKARTETTLKTANVTQQSTEEVSELLTAVWNGYKVSSDEAELYIDKLAAVAATTAADLEELSTGMSKVASAANTMGVDVDQLNAQLATIVSVTRQAPESVGTALRSIYARMGQLKADGTDEFGVTLGNYTEQMRSMGIEILDAQGEMRDMGDVIDEVAGKWQNWTQAQKVAAAQAMAGTRQYNNLVALFENWDMYTNALQTSASAMGTLQRQQDIYLDSTQAHLQQLSTETERTFQTLIDADTIEDLADVANGLLTRFNDILATLGGGTKDFIYFGNLVANIFNKQIGTAITRQIENLRNLSSNKQGASLAAEIASDFNLNIDQTASEFSLGEQVKAAEQILSVKNAISETEYQQLLSAQRKVGVVANQISELEQYKDISREILGNENATLQEYKDRIELATKANSEVEKELEVYTHLRSLINTADETTGKNAGLQLKDQVETIKELKLTDDQLLFSEEQRTRIAEILGKHNKDEILSNDEVLEIQEMILSRLRERIQVLEQLKAGQAGLTAEQNGELEKLNAQLKAQQDAIKGFADQKKTASNIQTVVGGLTSIGMLTQSIVGSVETLTDESIPLEQRVGRIAMTLVSQLPIVIRNIDNIRKTIKLITVENPWILAITVVLGAITAGVVAAVNAVNESAHKYENALKSATTATQDFEQQTQKAQQVLNNFNESLDAYDTAVDKLKELTKGSKEYNETLEEANDKVLELIRSNSELVNYVSKDSNGLYTIDEEQLQKTETSLNQNVIDNNLAKDLANRNAIWSGMAVSLQDIWPESYQKFEDSENIIQALLNLSDIEIEQYKNSDIEFKNFISGLFDASQKYEDGSNGVIDSLTTEKETLLDVIKSNKDLVKSNEFLLKQDTKQKLENMGLLEGKSETEAEALVNAVFEDLGDFQYNTRVSKGETFGIGSKDDVADKVAKSKGAQVVVYNGSGQGKNNTITMKDNITGETFDMKWGDIQFEIQQIQEIEKIAQQATKTVDDVTEAFGKLESALQVIFSKDDVSVVTDLFQQFFNNGKIDNAEDLTQDLIDQFLNIDVDAIVAAIEEDPNWQTTFTSLGVIDAFAGPKAEEQLKEGIEQVCNYITTDGAGLIEKALTETYETASQNAKSIGDILTSLEDGEDLSDEQLAFLDNLGLKYEELNTIREEGGHAYLELLKEIQEQEETNALVALENTEDQLITEIEDLYSRLNDLSEEELNQLEQKLQDLADTQYKIQLEIDADLASDVDQAFGLADELANLKSLITDNLEITFEEAQNIIDQGYGEMLIGARETANETIMLDKTTRDAFIDNKQAEIAANRDSKILQLQQERAMLESQLQILKQREAYIRQALAAETVQEKQSALTKAAVEQAKYESARSSMEEQLAKNETMHGEMSDSATKLYNSLKGEYEQDSTNQQAADNAATDNNAENTRARLVNWRSSYEAAKAYANQVRVSESGGTTGWPTLSVSSSKGIKTPSTSEVTSDYEEKTEEEVKSFFKALDEEFKDRTEEELAVLDEVGQAQLDDVLQAQNAINNEIGATYAGESALKSMNLSLDTAQANSQPGGSSSSSGSGGSASEKEEKVEDPDHIDYLEEETDRYHDINIELETLATDLDRVKKEQDKLTGKELIQNLDKQLDILEKQKEAYRTKLQLAKMETSEIRNALAAQGVQFNNDGFITNYADALRAKLNYVNSVIATYNSMTAEEQEAYKATVEAAQKDYEDFKDNLESYDELISKTIPDLEDNIQDAADQQIEIEIKKFNAEIEVRLDMSEAEKDFNEFKRKVIEGLDDDDILGNAKAYLEDWQALFNTNGTGIGPIQALTDQINAIQNELAIIDSGGTSSVYGNDRAAALEDLEKYTKDLMTQIEDAEDLVDKIKDSYLDMIDEAIKKFEEHLEQYEQIEDFLKHDIELVGLLYGDDAYDKMSSYYYQMEQNNLKQLDFDKRRLKNAEEHLATETDPEAIEKWREEWTDATNQLNSDVEDALKNIQDAYGNTIKGIFDDLDKEVTGGLGIDYIAEEWELVNDYADNYLDTINGAYEIRKLEHRFADAANADATIAGQTKINQLRDQELKKLREKDKLTKYDVDRANLLLDIAIKELALQNAQQNKSNMRLRRDAQGNYSYQFVADEDSISQAQQDLEEAQNKLYNLDKDEYRSNNEEILKLWQEYMDRRQEIAMDYTLDEEERQRKLDLLDETIGQEINDRLDRNVELRKTLMDTALTQYSQDLTGVKDTFLNTSDEIKEKMASDIMPWWNTSVDKMCDKITAEGGLVPTCSDAFGKLDEALYQYGQNVTEVSNVAGVDFNTLGTTIDDNVIRVQNLIDENDNLIESYNLQLEAIKMVIAELEIMVATYEDVYKAATKAVEASYRYQQAERDKSLNSAKPSGNSGGASYSGTSAGSGSSGSSGSGSVASTSSISAGPQPGSTSRWPVLGQVVTYLGGVYYENSDKGGRHGERGPGKQVTVTNVHTEKEYGVHLYSTDSAYGWVRPDQIAFDTGGYTGSWADGSGRLAWLHAKELVLNAQDTKNILAAVDAIRDVSSLASGLDQAAHLRLLGMMYGSLSNKVSSKKQALEQYVTITANFPNATNTKEIEDALHNLVNVASQHAFNSIR